MALYFTAGTSGDPEYNADRTTSLGTSTSETTFMYRYIQADVAGNQGAYGYLYFGASGQRIGLFNNGSFVYSGVDAGNSGNWGVQASTSVWHTFLARRTASVNSGRWVVNIHDGTSWQTAKNVTTGSGSIDINRIAFGWKTGDSYGRSYATKGLKISHVRLWTNTYLSDTEVDAELASATPLKTGVTASFTCVSDLSDSQAGDALVRNETTYTQIDSSEPTFSGSEPYSATGSTGIQNFEGFQASQIGIHRHIQPGIAYFNAEGFAPSTDAGTYIEASTGYANFSGFSAQAIYDSVGIAGRINFNTGTHQTHVTREFFGLLGQLRALGFLVDQTNSQGFFPNLGSIVFQGPTGATVTVISPPTTFTATSLLRETHFVGFQAQTIRDFFPISASTHALGFTPQYVEFIKEITGPTTGEVNFSGFQAQAIILGQINDAIGQKGEVNLVGFQHAVDMWRTLDILQGSINMQGFAAGIALFQGGTINLSGVTGEVNFDTLQQAIGMYRTFYPDSGLTNAEGYVPVPSTGTLVQSIVGILNQEGFIPFIVAERYRGIVGEMRLEGFAPTIGGGLWTPKRRRATSWAAIN